MSRRLAAILAADVAGYSRLTGADEEGTLARLRALRYELVNPAISTNRGRVVKTTGDGILIEFASAVDAMRCAIEVQRGMVARNAGLKPDERIDFRVGVHVGDVVVEGADLMGDGVNIAARLEGVAPPGGICLSEDAWRQVDGKVPAAFADLGEQALKNIARPVRVYRAEPTQGQETQAPVRPTLALPDKPSIAVLPFTNMSGDPEQEYFADGTVEDIITGLSRAKWLFVIARNSSFVYKGKAVDVKQVGRELGVRYVLEGGVRKAGNRVRITGQLIEAASGTHIWADRFEGGLEDIFDLQDRITSSVVGAIEPALRTAEMQRAQSKPTESLDAYDCFLRALTFFQLPTVAGSEDAIALCRKAIAIDPQYSSAYGLAGFCFANRIAQGWALNVEGERAEAIVLARQAIQFGADDPTALWMAGWALVLGARDFDRGLNAIDRSLSLNPNSARAWNASGWAHWNCGDGTTAIDHLQRAMRLSPLDPSFSTFKGGIAWAHFVEARYEEAVNWANMVLNEQPNNRTIWRCKVAACGLLDRMDDAREATRMLLTLQPDASIAKLRSLMPLKRAENMAIYLDGLRKAGLPE
ncbi:MAG TPA: adenylate/guanylate cyclase domain-containing protein [Stellaceae bacterium]|nr:adenylate/guanylate cyclase domain-containing protein [Stellaceae bacterium]